MATESTRETFKHAAVYSVAAGLGKLLSFALLPIYAHIFREIGYGVIGMFEAGLSLLMGLLSYGVNAAIIRIYHEEDKQEAKNRSVTTAVALVAVSGFAACLLAALFSKPLCALLVDDSGKWPLLCLALGSFFFQIIGHAASSILLIDRRSVLYSGIGVVRLFLHIGLSFYLIVLQGLGLFGYFLADLLVGAVSSAIFCALTVRRCGKGFDRRIARKLVDFFLPLIPGNLAAWVSRQVERVLVRFQIDLGSVGILEIGYKFPTLIPILITMPFMQSWHTKRVEIADDPGAPKKLGQMFTYWLFLVLFAGILLAVNIDLILEVLTPPEFWLAHRIARVEVLTGIFSGSYLHLQFGMHYAKDTKAMARIRIVMSAIKVAFSFLFISLWGIFGAAFSACFVALATLIWGGTVSQRRYRMHLEGRKILLMGAVATGLFVGLGGAHFAHLPAVAGVEQDLFHRLAGFLAQTPLGEWKSGKAIVLLQERTDQITDLVVRSLFCLSFLLLMPIVKGGSRGGFLARFRFWQKPLS